MAYKTVDLQEKAIEAIKKHNLFFIEDVVTFLPCNNKTFHNHKLHELPELKELLENNRIAVKLKLRKKWEKSDNATLQMGLMKLICTDDERKRLALEYRDHTSGGKIIKPINIIVSSKANGEELEKFIKNVGKTD